MKFDKARKWLPIFLRGDYSIKTSDYEIDYCNSCIAAPGGSKESLTPIKMTYITHKRVWAVELSISPILYAFMCITQRDVICPQSRWQIVGDTIVFCCVFLFADYSCFDLFIELRRRRRCLVHSVNISICFVVTLLFFFDSCIFIRVCMMNKEQQVQHLTT